MNKFLLVSGDETQTLNSDINYRDDGAVYGECIDAVSCSQGNVHLQYILQRLSLETPVETVKSKHIKIG